MKKIFFTLLLLWLTVISAVAEDNSALCAAPVGFKDMVTEPSPAVASQNRHIDCPVSYATGSYTLSVPLFSWDECGFPISLSLDYTPGIKAEDKAGFYGLGWSLGGITGTISRQIIGLPDENETIPLPDDLQKYADEADVEALRNMAIGRRDNYFDKYYYSVTGYSGCFIIKNKKIVELSGNDVTITVDEWDGLVPKKFSVSTPEGWVYRFKSDGSSSKKTRRVGLSTLMVDTDYSATTLWGLYEIELPDGVSTIEIAPASIDYSSDNKPRLYSLSFDRNGVVTGLAEDGKPLEDHVTITHSGFAGISSIVGNKASLIFGGMSKDGKITGLVKDESGNVVRRIILEFDTRIQERKKLARITIFSDDVILDQRTFEYHPDSYSSEKPSACSDFFGYSNRNKPKYTYIVKEWRGLLNPGPTVGDFDTYYDENGPNGKGFYQDVEKEDEVTESVIDLKASGYTKIEDYINPHRGYDFTHARSASMTQMTDANGLITTINYEPNVAPIIRGISDTIMYASIGIRVASIVTEDPINGRMKKRTFRYSNPKLTLPLSGLSVRDFLSQSGQYDIVGVPPIIFTYQSATFTSTCRVPGMSAESASILYEKVEEEISGSGVEAPIKTVYEFDLSHSLNTTRNIVERKTESQRSGYYSFQYLGKGISSSPYPLPFAESCEITSYFLERFYQKAPLCRTSRYEFDDNNAYRLVEETINTYSNVKRDLISTGIFCESYMRLQNGDDHFGYDYAEADETDFNVGVIEVERGRTYLDSTIVIKYYPDGSSRRMTTRYIYNDRENTTLNQFPDETSIPGSLHRPSGTIVECAGAKIEKYDLLGENINNVGKYFANYNNQERRALPVISRVKVDGRVFTTRNYYDTFGLNMLPRRMVTVGDDGSTVIDEMTVTAYNTCRQPLRIMRRGRPTMVYTYQTDGMTLLSSGIEGTELKNTYTAIPLIGYTSITTPAGNKTQYQYTGSRLTGILDRDGKRVKGYEYHLYDPQEYIHGYIRERQYLNAAGTASVTTTSLFDSYGEQYATIAGAASAPGVDIVSFSALDALGRQRRQYLPFTIPSDYSYQELALFGDSIAQSFTGDAVPFTESIFKSGSSSATPVITIDAGSDHSEWKNNIAEKCNTSTGSRLRCRRLSMSGASTLISQGYWPTGTLDVTEMTDADGAVSMEFADFRGRRLLSRRVLADGTMLDTYYVYDAWGNIVLVLPPMANSLPVNGSVNVTTSAMMQDYAYHYVYDTANRLVSKKLPGAEKIVYSYDKESRPAFTQDGNMRRDGKAMFTLYDKAGRVAVTGLCASSAMSGSGSVDMLATYNASQLGVDSTRYVTEVTLPGAEMLSATYYDAIPAFLDPKLTVAGALSSSKGLVTAQVDRVLGSAKQSRVTTVNYYDNRERVICTAATGADGSEITTRTEYDFAANPVKVSRTTKIDGTTLTDVYTYGYDRLNRPTTVSLSHGGAPAVTLISNTYDALGRLRSNGAPGKARMFYDYDLRGAVSKLTSNHFVQSLWRGTGKYTSRSGRITRNDINVTGRHLVTDYLYDKVGRLTRAEAKLENTGVSYTQEMEYDLNANVTAMRRYGAINAREGALIDDLMIDYQGNQMQYVADNAEDYPYEASLDFRARAPIESTPGASVAAPFSLLGLDPDPVQPGDIVGGSYTTDYSYDANGNMTQDRHSAITAITYNVLNLPQAVTYEGFAINLPVSQMVYDASGRKHIERNGAKRLGVFSGDVTRYVGDYIVVNDTVDRLQTPYGYLRDGEFHSYVFDYQGNVMAVVNGDAVTQTNLYYPDGLPMNVSTDPTANRFKYSGKELSLFRGLPVYDYTARHTLPQIFNTFRTPDPCAEKFYWLSPYSYCAGDPVNFVDTNGKTFKDVEQKDRLVNAIDARIERLNKLNKSNKSNESGTNLMIKHLNTTKEIISKMDEDSDRIYTFVKNDPGDPNYVYSKDGKNISILTSEDALSIHETEHIGQCYDYNKFRFDKNGKLKNPSNSVGQQAINEAKAYRAQYSFKPSSLSKPVVSIEKINISYLKQLFDRNTMEFLYKFVKYIDKNIEKASNEKLEHEESK